MAKKHWIYIKRGLSEDPKHREAMGNRIWLFIHIIDRADWETGIVHDWKDRDEAIDMGISYRTLQDQRQELEALGYITCAQKLHCQDIIIHNWVNPKDYGGKILNRRHGTENSVVNGTAHGTENSVVNGTGHPIADFRTPTSNPKIRDGWMDGDPICQFLLGLPGYNPLSLETDRRLIGEKNYSLEALRYLWEDCQADNDPQRGTPIGLLLYRCGQGMHSPRYLELLEQRRQQEAGEVEHARRAARTQSLTAQHLPDPGPIIAVDSRAAMWWAAAKNEISLEMNKQTFESYLRRSECVDYQTETSTYVVAMPDAGVRDWVDSRLRSSLERILTGINGAPQHVEFVVWQEWKQAAAVAAH